MNRATFYSMPFLLGALLIAGVSTAAAQDSVPVVTTQVVSDEFSVINDLARPVLLAILWTLLGLALFAGSIRLMVAISPFSVQKEIEEDQNVALGIVMGCMILGISIILAAAIIG